MSSFFTRPASQRKRKREPAVGGAERRTRRETRDDSISGSDSDSVAAAESASSDSDRDDEDAAAKRTRLAERYLENTRREILAEGFDAKDVDAELLAERMGERLQEDSAESKGKLYRFLAADCDYSAVTRWQFRADTLSLTGVAACPPYLYTTAKDKTLIKWDVSALGKPRQLVYVRGNGRRREPDYDRHTGAILCVAASEDGKFVATGGSDGRLIIWNADLVPLRVFTQHRDAVVSLAFRRHTNQLFSASRDRTIKLWSLDELAYVETLFGHQDEVVDVAALNDEKCVTVGARDRTARYWRVVDETQLVFRAGAEGCIDRVAMIDEETFITGSDNGTLALWNVMKKKAVFTVAHAHGHDPPPEPALVSAEADPEHDPSVSRLPQARWITALTALPFSDFVVSASWDGVLRIWRVAADRRRIDAVGTLGPVRGVVNDLAVYEREGGLAVAAAVGKEHRLGRWTSVPNGRNHALLFHI